MSVVDSDGKERVTHLSRFVVVHDAKQFMDTIVGVDPSNIIYYKCHRDDVEKYFILYFIRMGNCLLHYAVRLNLLLDIEDNFDTNLNPHTSTMSIVKKFLNEV